MSSVEKTIEEIDKEIDEYNEMNDFIRGFWDEYQKDLKEKELAFVEEVTQENPEWVKDRRMEFLEQEYEKLNKEYIDTFNEIQEMRKKSLDDPGVNWLWNLMADTIEKEKSKGRKVKSKRNPWIKIRIIQPQKHLPDITGEIKRLKFEMDCWINPQMFTESGGVNPEEVNMAREVSCENFIEVHKTAGDKKLALCPFHDDTNPSLVIYPAGKGYNCFSCGANGDTIDLVMKLQSLDFISAVKTILNTYGN